jgi:hypothetical protein
VTALSAEIDLAIDSFRLNPQKAGRRLRELLDEVPGAFIDCVTERLRTPGETPEMRYLVSLLVSRGMLLDALREVGRADAAVAGQWARLAQHLSPGFERTLARAVLDAEQAHDLNGETEFLLGLLSDLSGGATVLPLLGSLRTSEDPRVRSRMASLLGRTAGAQRWFAVLKDDPDPRVRANAIEALWNTEGPFAAACFESAVEDEHYRVVASAWVGIYLQGDAAAVAGLARMARHEDPNYRAAAAWAMGKTDDQRFVPLLWRLRREMLNAPAVARNALQAITQITQAVTNASPERLELRWMRQTLEAGGWQAHDVLVRDPKSGEAPQLRPTDWQLSVGGDPVWNYTVERLDAAEGVSLGVLLPASQEPDERRRAALPALLQPCFARRRTRSNRTVAFYSEDPKKQVSHRTGDFLSLNEELTQPAASESEPLQMLTDPSHILNAADEYAGVDRLPEGPLRPIEALAGWLGSAPGERHLVLVLDQLHPAAWRKNEVESALAACRAHSVTLHVLASWRLPQAALEVFVRLAADSGGVAMRVADHAACARQMDDLLSMLACRYRVRHEASAGPAAVKLTVQSKRFRAEISVEGPGDII